MENEPTNSTIDPILGRLRRAAQHVFGDSPLGTAVREQCDDYAAELERIAQARGGDLPVIAVIGAAGQGKTWLVRGMVSDMTVRAALPSGDRAAERTQQTAWIGSRPPLGFDPQRERYLPCRDTQMLSLGTTYLLVDTPGATDVEPLVAETARQAIAQAVVQIFVIRRDQLRSGDVDLLTEASEGTLVAPVVNLVPRSDPQLDDDVANLMSRLRSLAPTSLICPPVLIPDADRHGLETEAVTAQALADLTSRLTTHLSEVTGGRRLHWRVAAARKRFQRELNQTLANQLPELAAAEQRLREAADALPREIAESLIGGDAVLSVAVRTRLRLLLLEQTSGLWFPYRTLLMVLNLTHGAWDRLVLAMAGSLPSLITTAWTAMRNLKDQATMNDPHQALRGRADALVHDRLRPILRGFRRELQRLRANSELPETRDHASDQARLVGIDALQVTSSRIFDRQVQRFAMGRFASGGLALLGTVLFWLLLAGPIVSLYREYGTSSVQELSGSPTSWRQFPEPSAAMLLTSLLLSLFPSSMFAMLVIAWAQSAGRVRRCAAAIRQDHLEAIQTLAAQQTLQVQYDDPLVDDARYLLNLGPR